MNNKTSNLQKRKNQIEEPEVDLMELIRKVFKERKFVLKICGFAALIAIIVAFSLPKEYTTEVQLAPEASDGSSSKGSLGGLAAIAGLSLGSGSGTDAYSPDLYPDIVKSTPFILELFPIVVRTIDRKNEFTVYEYMDQHQKSAWWSYILKSPMRLIHWVRNIGAKKEIYSQEEEKATTSVYMLDEDQDRVLYALQDRISVEVDKKTYVISISVKMQDPLISAELTQIVLEKLQQYITDYRTRKAKQDLEFTEMAYKESQERYFQIQRSYASFEDANKHISTATYRTEQERLKNEVTLAYNLYNSLAQQREQDRLRVQEQTPVFALIEPAKVPLFASSPRKFLILFGFIFLGGVFAAIYVLVKDHMLENKGNEVVEE